MHSNSRPLGRKREYAQFQGTIGLESRCEVGQDACRSLRPVVWEPVVWDRCPERET